MFAKGGRIVNTNRLLISSAMLTALCEQKELDNLSLLEPFVRMSISRLSDVSSQINKSEIIGHLQNDFAFSDVPAAVLDKVLLRMASKKDSIIKCTSYEENKFILLQDLSEERKIFEGLQSQAQNELNSVIDSLLHWFNINIPKLKATQEKIIEWLGDFFESRGVDVLFGFDELKTATTANTDAINYQIGRFIIYTKENDPMLFEKIVHITQGMMLVSAIYIDTRPATKFVDQRAMGNVSVFLDTTLLLCAMGYKTSPQKDATCALIHLLSENGAQLFVFPQHFREMKDILYAFKMRDGYSKVPRQTLEGLEENRWTTTEIDNEIHFLEKRLEKKLGVIVYNGPQFTDGKGNLLDKGSYISINDLAAHIKKRIPQYRNNYDMLKNDVDAIAAIVAQRNGMTFDTIENCCAIFVSTNYTLVRESNSFLKYQAYNHRIAPSISDTDLTTILWLKYGFSDQSIPRLLLVQHANAAIAPTDAVLSKFFQITKNLEERGTLTPDEAAFMRYDIYARGEITAMCGGESSELDDTSVLAVRDRIKERYSQEVAENSSKEISTLRNKVNSAEKKHAKIQEDTRVKVDQAVRKMNRAHQANKDAKRLLLKDIKDRADKRATHWTTIIFRLIGILLLVVTAFCVCLSFYSGFNSIAGRFALILAIISAGSTFSLLWPAFKCCKIMYTRVYNKLFDKFYAIEYEKIKTQIKILDSSL